jgi:hypothetical protein
MATAAEGPQFPNLTPTNHSETSEIDYGYNCIAWAAGDNKRWWWPQPETGYMHWPAGARREATRESFIEAFETLGYSALASPDTSLEPGAEKVAIFENAAGKPTHAARQLASGAWTSKLGTNIDIEHQTADGVEGPTYGKLAVVLVRKAETKSL